jgi:ech hydrogenase subunit B
VLVFFIVGMYMLTGSFRIQAVSLAGRPLIFSMPLIFISMLFVMGIKFKKSPFDLSTSHHAHQELIKGITTEFSGPALGVIEVAHWYETILLLGLMFLFWKTSIVMGLLLAAFTFIFEIIIDNISARLTWQWMLRTSWSIIITLSIINIIGIYLFNIKLV